MSKRDAALMQVETWRTISKEGWLESSNKQHFVDAVGADTKSHGEQLQGDPRRGWKFWKAISHCLCSCFHTPWHWLEISWDTVPLPFTSFSRAHICNNFFCSNSLSFSSHRHLSKHVKTDRGQLQLTNTNYFIEFHSMPRVVLTCFTQHH